MKQVIIVSLAIVAIAGGLTAFFIIVHNPSMPSKSSVNTVKTATYKDQKTGAEVAVPETYKSVPVTNKTQSLVANANEVLLQYERANPQAFIIIRHDTGLALPANLLHVNTVQYVENSITQFFPTKYGSSYKSISLERKRIRNHDAIEHIYSFTDKDGKPNKVRLIVLVWSDDDSYNFILQSHALKFDAARGDLDAVVNSFKIEK